MTARAAAWRVAPPENAAQARAFRDIFVQSLMVTPPPRADWFERWLAVTGRRNLRLAWRGRELAGGLALLRMGQFFGGRSVPLMGVSAVAVAPEHRSRGAAKALMQAALAQAREDGFPLSGLYPAAQQLYRGFGYELAGSRTIYRIPPHALVFGKEDRRLEIRRMAPADHAAVKACHAERSSRRSGELDRSDWLWQRILDPPIPVHGYVVPRGRAVEGYLVLTEVKQPSMRYEVHVFDIAATTERAARRLLALLADHRSMSAGVLMSLAPADPLLQLLPEQDWTIEKRFDWMLRVIDVPKALEARGYSEHLALRVELEVADDRARSPQRLVLEVADGRARVKRGGRGRVHAHVRGLASLYSGYLSAFDLVLSGLVSGPDRDLAALSAALAGPAPSTADMY